MKVSKRINLFVLICLVIAFVPALKSYGYSLLSGITVAEGDNGIVVFEIRPGTPAKKAGIRKGDVIFKIGKKNIKGMKGYVKYSRSLVNKEHDVQVLVKRKGRVLTFLIEDFSVPVKEFWDENAPYSKEKIPKREDPYSYWIGRGKRKLASVKDDTPYNQQIKTYHMAINDMFYALHYDPKMVMTMVLIADTYKMIGEISIKNGLKEEAVDNISMSVRLYKKAMEKTDITNESLKAIRENLQTIERLLSVSP
ncbi:MAG: PDZ domain-containing protein [Candidatus Anammoxibacter sp.]